METDPVFLKIFRKLELHFKKELFYINAFSSIASIVHFLFLYLLPIC